jgi:acylphosphatase
MRSALLIEVNGIVQGVGFRPFVYRLARRYLITGWVLNAADGVKIHAEGEENLLDEFVMEIHDHAPAAAKVESIKLTEVPLEPFDDFRIVTSDDAEAGETTLVSPDLATCDDCVRELFDPENRRYHYPFINCTNCGSALHDHRTGCPTTARAHPWRRSPCVPIARTNMRTRRIAASTRSRMRAFRAARISTGAFPAPTTWSGA